MITQTDDTPLAALRQAAYCPDQGSTEPTSEYRARVLGYALQFGIEPLSLSQLEHADSCAQACVAALPMKLDPDQARHDQALHALRSRLAARMHEKRAQRASLQRLIDGMEEEATTAANAPAPADTVEVSPAERAARLLKAALILIMDPPSGNGGGQHAKLQPPTPKLPPSGDALPVPGSPAAQPRRF